MASFVGGLAQRRGLGWGEVNGIGQEISDVGRLMGQDAVNCVLQFAEARCLVVLYPSLSIL